MCAKRRYISLIPPLRTHVQTKLPNYFIIIVKIDKWSSRITTRVLGWLSCLPRVDRSWVRSTKSFFNIWISYEWQNTDNFQVLISIKFWQEFISLFANWIFLCIQSFYLTLPLSKVVGSIFDSWEVAVSSQDNERLSI